MSAPYPKGTPDPRTQVMARENASATDWAHVFDAHPKSNGFRRCRGSGRGSSTRGSESWASGRAESACLGRAGTAGRWRARRRVAVALPGTPLRRALLRHGVRATSDLRLRTVLGPHRAGRSSRRARYRSKNSHASIPRPASESSEARSKDACNSARSSADNSSSISRTSTSAPSGKSVGSSRTNLPFLTWALRVCMPSIVSRLKRR